MAATFHLRLAPPEDFRRESLDSPVEQGINEVRRYLVDMSEWDVDDTDGLATSDATLKVWVLNEHGNDQTDVTTDVYVSGSLSVSTDAPLVYFALENTEAGNKYRWALTVELAETTLEPYGVIEGRP
jgi:hypothetical protein